MKQFKFKRKYILLLSILVFYLILPTASFAGHSPPAWISFGEPVLVDDGASCKLRVNWENQTGNRIYEVQWRYDGYSTWYKFYYDFGNNGSMKGFGLGLKYYFRVRSFTDHWSAWSASVSKVIDSEWGPSKSWKYNPVDSDMDGKYGSYSPYMGKTQIYKYFSGGKNRIGLWSYNAFFDDTAINSIQDYWVDKPWYYTWDQSINLSDSTDHSLNAFTSYFDSNIPSPYYDTDDDNGDGNRDETEVTTERPDLLKKEIPYKLMVSYFTWNNPGLNKYSFIQSSSQLSENVTKKDGDKYNTAAKVTTSGVFSYHGSWVTKHKYPWGDWF